MEPGSLTTAPRYVNLVGSTPFFPIAVITAIPWRLTIPMVWPSGFERNKAIVPVMPPAPGILRTTILTFLGKYFGKTLAIAREYVS